MTRLIRGEGVFVNHYRGVGIVFLGKFIRNDDGVGCGYIEGLVSLTGSKNIKVTKDYENKHALK